MAKTRIQALTLNGSAIDSNTYNTPKGNSYTFFRGCWTDILDDDDAVFFLQAGGGKFFKAETMSDVIKQKVSNIINSIAKPKDPEVIPSKDIPAPAPAPADNHVHDVKPDASKKKKTKG